MIEAPSGEPGVRYEKAARLLRLALDLAGSAEGMTLDEMARAQGVDRRTAERMRDTLRDLFPGFEEIQDGRGKRFRIVGGLSGFMLAPSVAELAELGVAAATLRRAGDPARAGALESLSRKINAALREAERRRLAPDLDALRRAETTILHIGPRPLEDPVTLATIRQAIMAGALCVFDYPTPGEGARRRREVRPFGVLFGKSYYLVGPEAGMRRPALWRLDRMSEVAVGDAAEPAPRDFNLATFAAQSVGVYQEKLIDVVLRFTPEAAADAMRFIFHPTQSVEEEPDGSLIVRFRSGGQLELVHHLFSWGDAVEIVAPPQLRNLMGAELTRAMQRYQSL